MNAAAVSAYMLGCSARKLQDTTCYSTQPLSGVGRLQQAGVWALRLVRQLLARSFDVTLAYDPLLCSWCRDRVEHQGHVPLRTLLGPRRHGEDNSKQQQQSRQQCRQQWSLQAAMALVPIQACGNLEAVRHAHAHHALPAAAGMVVQ